MLRLWLAIRHNGWFRPGTIGSLIPQPARWQGWLCFAGFLSLLVSTVFLPGRAAAPVRIGMVAVYIAFGIATFD